MLKIAVGTVVLAILLLIWFMRRQGDKRYKALHRLAADPSLITEEDLTEFYFHLNDCEPCKQAIQTWMGQKITGPLAQATQHLEDHQLLALKGNTEFHPDAMVSVMNNQQAHLLMCLQCQRRFDTLVPPE